MFPEPGNWFDCEALAVDAAGQRPGYIRPTTGHLWHEIIRRLNACGFRVEVEAKVRALRDRSGLDLRFDAFLPDDDQRREISAIVGLHGEFEVMLTRTSTDLRRVIRSDHPLDDGLVGRLLDYHDCMPTLPWGKTGPYARENGVPRVIYQLIDDARHKRHQALTPRLDRLRVAAFNQELEARLADSVAVTGPIRCICHPCSRAKG